MLNSAGDRTVNISKARTHAKYGSEARQSTASGNWRQGFESGGFTAADWKQLTVTNMDRRPKVTRTPLLQIL
jgi:hypothetical protein